MRNSLHSWSLVTRIIASCTQRCAACARVTLWCLLAETNSAVGWQNMHQGLNYIGFRGGAKHEQNTKKIVDTLVGL